MLADQVCDDARRAINCVDVCTQNHAAKSLCSSATGTQHVGIRQHLEQRAVMSVNILRTDHVAEEGPGRLQKAEAGVFERHYEPEALQLDQASREGVGAVGLLQRQRGGSMVCLKYCRS